jgi:alpha-1,3-rhamnosyltransferase
VIVFGKEQLFDSDNRNHLIDIYPHDCDLYFFDLPSQQQFLALLERCLIPAPTNFIKSSFVKNNPFDERFRLMEDYPYWLKMTHQGIKLDFINEVTVLYRWGESVSKTKVNLHPKAGCENSRQFYWLEKRNLLKLYRPELIDKERKQLLEYELADLFFKNRRTLISRIIMRLLRYFINLFHYDVM